MTKTSFADSAALMSPRTVKYIEALARDGYNFDYDQWLKRVREDRTQATQALTAITCREVGAVGNQTGASGYRNASPNFALATSYAPIHKALRQVHRAPKGKAAELRIRPRLKKIRDVWDDFQASRTRDAVYGYLEAVFAIVEHYKVRQKTKTLLRHAFKFAELPFDRNADPFTTVIRCTCADDDVDSKTISKWARALRYASRSKEPAVRLRKFMKEAGGVNACVSLYSRRCKRDNRRSPRDRN
jgi:hypothetical protein